PPAVAPPVRAPREPGSRRPWIILGIGAIIVLVAVVGAVAIGRHSSKTPSLTFEPARSAGDNPFTDAFVVGKPVELTKVVRGAAAKTRTRLTRSKQTATLVIDGTAPGTYGGNGATPVCDARALVASLESNPGNAAAWATTLGTTEKGIRAFVSGLT